MDNVTHSLVGLMLARVSGKNAAMMVVAANLPDIDIVSWTGGTLTYLEYHRGIAHSLITAPLLALIPMLLFRSRNWQSYLACLVAVLSHLLLDWTNVYGVRLLLPFSSRWLRLDTVDIVDPWILLGFLLAIAAPALVGLVSSEIGAKKNAGVKRGWAWAALVFLVAWEGGRFAAHQRALAVMSARLYEGRPANRLTAMPNRWTPFHWRGVVEGDGYVVDVLVDLNTEFDPSAGRIDYTGPPNEAALKTSSFRSIQQVRPVAVLEDCEARRRFVGGAIGRFTVRHAGTSGLRRNRDCRSVRSGDRVEVRVWVAGGKPVT